MFIEYYCSQDVVKRHKILKLKMMNFPILNFLLVYLNDFKFNLLIFVIYTNL